MDGSTSEIGITEGDTTPKGRFASGPPWQSAGYKRYLRLVRHRDFNGVNKSMKSGRRAIEIALEFEAAFGREITAEERRLVHRAAVLAVLAEDAAIKRLNGDSAVTLDEVLRLDFAAAAAKRALGLPNAKSDEPEAPSLISALNGERHG
jgi:hypothetical protein